jgi:hypothetical protein
MVRENQAAARQLGYATVPALKKAVARRMRGYVEGGGFLFAMCTATETLELALAAHGVDIAAAYADGTPMDPDADAKLDWSQAMACQNAHLVSDPAVAAFSDIDTRSTTRAGASRSAPSSCSTSAPRSTRCPACWCSATAR